MIPDDTQLQGSPHRRERRWEEVGAGIALSLLFHGAVVAALVVSVFWAPQQDEEEPQWVEYEEVELLALGEEPDPDTLPRLTGDEGTPPDVDDVAPDPEMAVPAEPEPDPEPDDEIQPDPEELERQRQQEQQRLEEERQRREREQRQRQMDDALGQFQQQGRGDEAPEGSPDGVPEGTSTDGDVAVTYHARLARAIGQRWTLPAAISESEAQQLAGGVRVRIVLTEQGHIDDFDMEKSSGRSLFDRAIKSTLREFMVDEGEATLPLPDDDQLRQDVLTRGRVLTNWEHLAN